MSIILADRVKETTISAGTGDILLGGAAPGFQSFAIVGNGNTTYYCISGRGTGQWEVGIGTYTSSGTTLARTTVLSNSSATQPTALTFSSGVKDIFITYPSEKSVNLDASGNATALGTPVAFAGTNITGTATAFTAGNVTTNANLTGPITSVGNATSIASQTGTGSTFVMNTSPVLVTPNIGTPSAGTLTNCTFPTLNQNTTGNAATASGATTRFNLGTDGATPYVNPTGPTGGISFGGWEGGSTRQYGVFTEYENVGGNYAKLAINWHTGIRIGAYPSYGGIRFFNNAWGSGGTGVQTMSINDGDNHVRVANNLYVGGALYATGAITAMYSDSRLKTDIQPIQNALDKVDTLTGMTFTQNELAETFGYKDYTRQVGVFAQDVQQVQPEAVKPAPFDIDENNESKSGENYLTVQYEKLVPLLIEAIKELRLEVKELKGL